MTYGSDMNSNCQSPLKKSPSQSVCVLGLGLIGGSLLRRVTACGYPAFGWNRSIATVEQASLDGMDVSGDLPATLQRAAREDALLVVAVPLFALRELLVQIAEYAPQCPLTDVVSVKVEVLRAVQEAGLAATYVGSHPMAGTENSGWDATDPSLFENATWVVMTGGAESVTARVREIAETAGSVVVETDPLSHDGAVACISHVPHLVAEALSVAAVTEQVGGGDTALCLSAGSFRDGTRVAGSAPALVRAMCEGNREAVLPVLAKTIALLQQSYDELSQQGTCEILVEAGYAAHQRYRTMMKE
uniref:prephenate dehydrogenase n=1 Tax=Lawsonella clevelandensis TaxID=1528099 RepID=UPI0023F3C1D5